MYSFILSLTPALDGGGWSQPRNSNNNNNHHLDDDDEDVTVLSPSYFKIYLAVFFAYKNILCEFLHCCICIVSYGLRVGRVPRFILLWAQKYFKPALLWDDTVQHGTLK